MKKRENNYNQDYPQARLIFSPEFSYPALPETAGEGAAKTLAKQKLKRRVVKLLRQEPSRTCQMRLRMILRGALWELRPGVYAVRLGGEGAELRITCARLLGTFRLEACIPTSDTCVLRRGGAGSASCAMIHFVAFSQVREGGLKPSGLQRPKGPECVGNTSDEATPRRTEARADAAYQCRSWAPR